MPALACETRKRHIACMDVTGQSGALIGMGAMALVFAVLAGLELVTPFRRERRKGRWLTNLALFAIDTLAVRLLLPLAMVGAALAAEHEGWGLFNLVEMPGWLAFVVTILALDLALYVQHWVTHRVPLLWRLHRVHHSDTGFDVTTASRFHPVEIVASMAYKMAVVVALGAPALAVFVFETGFALFTLWTHANLSLPGPIDRAVRRLFVTPDMHRIHHSVRTPETNSNYGTFLSGWDRLFGTYVGAARDAPGTMPIGLEEWRDGRTGKLGWSLLLPFRRH